MSFSQLEKIVCIKANSFPVPGGQVAHWITKYGQVIDIDTQRHIHYLAINNDQFNISDETILKLHEVYEEKLGTEGKARDELILTALKSGWATTRFIGGHNSHWVVRVWGIDTYRTQHSLVCWAQEIVKQEGPHSDKYAPIYVYDYKKNKRSKHSLEDLNNGWFRVK